MEWWVVPLGAVVLAIGVIAWVREQRTWQRFYATTGRDPEAAVRLHGALRSAGVRSRYKLVGTGVAMHQVHSSLNQTALVLVHRDDLHRAHEVRAGLANFT